MMKSPVQTRYSATSIALHWLILVLIAAAYTCIELREYWPKGDPTRAALKSWHFTLGLTVFVLMLARIFARFTSPPPAPISPAPPQWQHTLAKIAHLALYALFVIMPIGGWLILSAEGDPINFWGISLPPLVSPNKDLAELIEELHETGGKIGYALIGLHAAAALFHHYVMKDNTLTRILPGRS